MGFFSIDLTGLDYFSTGFLRPSSATVNPGDKADKQKPVNDHESNEEIKRVGHRSLLFVETERDRATPVPLWNKDKECRNRQRFPEKSLLWQAQDASVF